MFAKSGRAACNADPCCCEDGQTVFCGDCLEVLDGRRMMADKMIDACAVNTQFVQEPKPKPADLPAQLRLF